MLRLFFLPEEQGNILFCVFQFEQLGLGFLVLLIELCLFGSNCAYSASSFFGLGSFVVLFALK